MKLKLILFGVMITATMYLGAVRDPILGFLLLLFIGAVAAYAEGKFRR